MSMSLSNKQKELKRNIALHSKAIRKKYLALQKGQIETHKEMEKLLNPVIAPINELVQIKKSAKQSIGLPCEGDEVQLELEYPPEMTPPKHYRSMLETTYGRTAAPYIEKITAIKPRNVDTTYGLKWNSNTQIFTIGNSPVQIKHDKIQIGNKQYVGRPGLYELLVKNNPNKSVYNSYDMATYKQILEKTSAHKKDYDENQNINVENSKKFNNIIRKLFPRGEYLTESSYSGDGLWKDVKAKSKIDYKYWDDPNELIDRLRLLMASTEAGNTSHNNEIQEIIAELREKHYIQ